ACATAWRRAGPSRKRLRRRVRPTGSRSIWATRWRSCSRLASCASRRSLRWRLRSLIISTSSAGRDCGRSSRGLAVRQAVEKVEVAAAAPKGAVEAERLTASLKRCPDTKRKFLSGRFKRQRSSAMNRVGDNVRAMNLQTSQTVRNSADAFYAAGLLRDLIDYAGLFPPASLAIAPSVANYDSY